ncbi:molybdopterin-binding protein [Siculibacillus lacustris]|uniref:Molybdopterin molybdenumtransferase n=1 Tax=Siculibacillus lacustris TaxID=1549641 RepID=A0A4Q9VRM3_9HYPH|nr:molybdopterin-binding protein [Siculibacillus lacustris]TBW38422.1 molybdopterin-binding protein [Siculibacillus lacustris]
MPEAAGFVPRIAVAEVVAAWIAGTAPLAARSLPLAEAAGAVAAEPVTAPGSLPASAIALIDGRAVMALETLGASPYAPAELSRSLAVAAGDAVPPPFDAVAATDEGTATTADVALGPGTALRRSGADAGAGTVLIPAGTRLGARALAIAAAAGLGSLSVRQARVVLAADGGGDDPVIALVRGFLAARGVVTTVVALAEAGTASALEPDLMLLFGGAAIGATDPALNAAVAAPGWRAIGRPALRPGETQIAGRIGGAPALVLPSRVDEALAAGLALIAPLLDARARAAPDPRATVRPLARKLVSAIGWTELALFAAVPDGGAWEPLGVGLLPAATLVRATHWSLLPPESEGHDAATPHAADPWPDGL